tara:strand:+ start:5367 stop:5834 length:468 start_codon:yes stop_codon:yes gene_type:complete
MATTHKVRWAVSASPIVTVDAVDGASLETSTLHENIRRTLGGSGEVTNDGAIDFGGVTDGGTNYLSATAGGVNIGDGDTRFIWVRHTGYAYSSSSALGALNSDKIKIFIDTKHIASLSASEGWIIPLPDTSDNATNFIVKRGGSTDIAIEVIGLD